MRRAWADAWRKHCENVPLTPLERQIVAVVKEHPEYQDTLVQEIDREYTPAAGRTNPYLHMGLHLGLRDQVATDRPAGIAAVYGVLVNQFGDRHVAEHRMIDCLAETLWEAGRTAGTPDETRYLERLQRLAR